MSKILKVVGASWLQTKISSYILGILGVLAILALFVGQIERIEEDGNYSATVFYSEKTGYRIEYWGQSNKLVDIPKGAARAYFRMDIDTTGWSLLDVETDESYPDHVQAYAAGIVEGALTWSLIHSHLENTIRAKCENQPTQKLCNKLRDALDKSVDVWRTYADDRGEDPFWHQVSLYYTQINGIFTGWKHGVERSMKEYETDISDLYWLNAMGEVIEIQKKLNITLENDSLYNLPDLSSAFLRIVNETTSDGTVIKKLYLSQNNAGSYSSMTRILKRYKLNYHSTSKNVSLVHGTSVDFSGYPGAITSQDEFYIIKGVNQNMAVVGNPLRNYNENLWKKVNITEQIPVGPRVSAANRLSSNISSWAHTLASSNSGTGSKQWLIVDFNKLNQVLVSTPKTDNNLDFVRNKIVSESTTVNKDVRHTVVHHGNTSLVKGLVELLEQVPGLTHSVDLSDAFLERGYWTFYGLPFFKDITEVTHVNKMEEMHGKLFSELQSPRALIFQRGYRNATNMDSIIKLMRQNNMTVINNSSNNATACDTELECIIKEDGYWSVLGVRGDLVSKHSKAYGVIDTKVVSGTLNGSIEFVAVSGPPYTQDVQDNRSIPMNKGNVASIYTDQFDDQPNINGLEIRDLVKQQQEEAEQHTLEMLNRFAVKPFQWSDSEFRNSTREGLPDSWPFRPYTPNWSW